MVKDVVRVNTMITAPVLDKILQVAFKEPTRNDSAPNLNATRASRCIMAVSWHDFSIEVMRNCPTEYMRDLLSRLQASTSDIAVVSRAVRILIAFEYKCQHRGVTTKEALEHANKIAVRMLHTLRNLSVAKLPLASSYVSA